MIDVLTLNYNDFDTTSGLIKRYETYDFVDKIVVVDNCSSDDSFSKLSTLNVKKTVFLKTEKNGGYGYGNNYGIKYLEEHSTNENFLLCNPDTNIEEDVLVRLDRFLRENQDVAIAAPKMLNSNGNLQKNSFFRIRRCVVYILSFEYLLNKIFKFSFYKADILENKDTFDVDGISGSLFLANKKNFLKTGLYDENLFLYCEERVLGIKLKELGLRSCVLLNEVFTHDHSVSITKTYKSNLKKLKLLNKSRKYVVKYYYHAGLFLRVLCNIFCLLSYCEAFILSVFRKNLV